MIFQLETGHLSHENLGVIFTQTTKYGTMHINLSWLFSIMNEYMTYNMEQNDFFKLLIIQKMTKTTVAH